MATTTTATGFLVSDVTPATEPLVTVPYIEAVRHFLGGPVEACSRYHGQLVAGVDGHPLVVALHTAFVKHYPVRLSPDAIWLTLAKGLADHVNQNAAALRRQFVAHDGKLRIEVRRDDFVKGSPENPWEDVFAEFSSAVRGHIGDDTHRLIVADFSTTGPAERAASEVVLLDAVQAYFQYVLISMCGIPRVELEGTADDWRSVAVRAEGFARFGLGGWVRALRPVLAEFVAAAEGRVNRPFWESIYKWHGPDGSGCPHVSGWATKLFPYLWVRRWPAGGALEPNPYLNAPASAANGPLTDMFPNTPGSAPFAWDYLGTRYEMEFVGGLLGVSQDADTLALRPEVGWAVRDVSEVNAAAAERAAARAAKQKRFEAERAAEAAAAAAKDRQVLVAPRVDPAKPRFEQFFTFVCPLCGAAEEIGLWSNYKICAGCNTGIQIVREPRPG